MKTSRLALAVGVALAALGTTAFALPSGGNVTSGAATVATPNAGKMEVRQTTDKAIVNWQSFSIGSGEWVQFVQPGASSVILNRVVGGSPTEIFGRMTANGQVFLTNASGVLFAPGASIEVGGLFASSLSIGDSDFLAGRYQFSNSGAAAPVVNRGTIVTPNGYTVLAAPQVRNEGVIVARLGTASLAAGDRVTLDMVGDGLVNVSVDQSALNALALNSGSIEADGGRVLLTARSANALLDTVINNTGAIRANSLVERSGEIVLDAGERGTIDVTGTLESQGGSVIIRGGSTVNISGTQTITAGPGSITVLGNQASTINVTGTSTITGGSIIIGTGGLGTVNLSGRDTISAPGGSLTVTGGAVNNSGAVLLSSRSGVTEESLVRSKVAGSLTLAEVTRTAVAAAQPTTETRRSIDNGFGPPPGTLAPMQHHIIGTGIRIPAN